MAIAELVRLLRPPGKAVPNDWVRVEERLGTKLPASYKDFVDTYGTGAIGDFLWVLTPSTPNRNLSLFEKGQDMRDAYTSLHRGHPREYPFATYPERGGLLPWGITDNGDELYWVTDGNSDHWPSVVYATSIGSYERFAIPITDLLTKWLDGSLRSDVLVPVPARFTPHGQ